MNGTDETDQDFKFCSGLNVGLEKRGTGVNDQFNVLSLVLYLIVFEMQPGCCIIVVYCSRLHKITAKEQTANAADGNNVPWFEPLEKLFFIQTKCS